MLYNDKNCLLGFLEHKDICLKDYFQNWSIELSISLMLKMYLKSFFTIIYFIKYISALHYHLNFLTAITSALEKEYKFKHCFLQ